MAMSTGGAEGEPMMDINTTPLIDVMLVLLIMFIITIPIQTHAVKLDLPVNTPPQQEIIDPVKNKIVIMPDRAILWNGTPVDPITLRQFLDQTTMMNPEPELHLQPHPEAPYETVDQVMAVTKRAGVTKMGFVGNEAYGNF
ncbi:MAG TPA: biopolymer transporter ExbD [Allosphingosinicella sp.]|nr:biopolymer transporter ExbD [Allosphingosinicella sp.]